MFFKEYFKSVADIIEAKYKGHLTLNQNPADKGELSEIFIKDFLIETLGDSFKIARGGKIIDYKGELSKQLDIIIQGKKSLKLFYDKGIYPTETVYGVISVTSTLDKKKVLDCCDEFISIPRKNLIVSIENYVGNDYMEKTKVFWRTHLPVKVIFAYTGTLQKDWIPEIIEKSKKSHHTDQSWINNVPDLIIVNKKGYFIKGYNKEVTDCMLQYFSFDENHDNYGLPFSKILLWLNTIAYEEAIVKPVLEYYLNQDKSTIPL